MKKLLTPGFCLPRSGAKLTKLGSPDSYHKDLRAISFMPFAASPQHRFPASPSLPVVLLLPHTLLYTLYLAPCTLLL
jgi:hypothetical protein